MQQFYSALQALPSRKLRSALGSGPGSALGRGLGSALSIAFAASLLLLQACDAQSPSQTSAATTGTELILKASTALPPGQSGFVSTQGQINGSATGSPADFGEHLDDQRELYWNFQSKDGLYHQKGPAITPKTGVSIYLDEFGIPSVYADNIGDVWFGAGYIIAQQRLFLMDAVRRLGRGNFSELLGCGSIADDVMQRTLTYSAAEYQSFFENAEPDSQASVDGYVAGVNAWINEVRGDPSLLPAEYTVLSTSAQQIADFTRQDILAAGVLITRLVATDGGTEWENIRMLRALEAAYGEDGRDAFLDINWSEDTKAATTVPASLASFSNHQLGAGGREAVFNRVADWVSTLPDSLEHGPGTGAAPLPVPCDMSPGGIFGGLNDPQGQKPQAVPVANTSAESPGATAAREVRSWGRGLHGGSYMAVIGKPALQHEGTLMVNGPQLGYSYPSQLVEIEIHGGGYNARGSTVPGLPAVGIGYSEFVAWGLTTGYSKTIDSFIETICSTAEITAGDCAANQYRHDGEWKDMYCRNETFNYRGAAMGAPFGPANLSVDYEICRTVHGPIVARDDTEGLARSVSYAMRGREIDNIEAIREFSRAKTFAEMQTQASRLTWNENLMVASKDGHIGFFHPGLYPVRHAETDQRFPIPGEGERDFAGFLPFSAMPQAIDPPQGYLANWNNKPAIGWLGGEGISSHSRPGGARERVSVIQDLLATRNDWDFDSLQDFDRKLGTTDPKAQAYLPTMLAFAVQTSANLSDRQRAALAELANWDGIFYDFELDINDENALAKPPTTIFSYWVTAIQDLLFSELKTMPVAGVHTPDDDSDDQSVFQRQNGVGNHVFDMSVLDNLALRILEPSSSSLAVRFDWAQGMSRNDILNNSLNTALDRLEADFGSSNTADYQRQHPRSEVCSLTGGLVGPCITMPYQDRGSWNQIIAYEPE